MVERGSSIRSSVVFVITFLAWAQVAKRACEGSTSLEVRVPLTVFPITLGELVVQVLAGDGLAAAPAAGTSSAQAAAAARKRTVRRIEASPESGLACQPVFAVAARRPAGDGYQADPP